MKGGKIIPLSPCSKILARAQMYLQDLEALIADPVAATSILLKALPCGDLEIKRKIIYLLPLLESGQVIWPLYRIVMNPDEDEEIRNGAAIQLSLAASHAPEPTEINEALVRNLENPDAQIRGLCALALGWEGNRSVLQRLLRQLSDQDIEVRQAVITALANIGEPGILDLLSKRLRVCGSDEKKIILLNIWRFEKLGSSVVDIYLEHLNPDLPELVMDILNGLSMLPLSTKMLSVYLGLLQRKEPFIRRQVMENMSQSGILSKMISAYSPGLPLEGGGFQPVMDFLHQFLFDPDSGVRQSTIRLFARIEPSPSRPSG